MYNQHEIDRYVYCLLSDVVLGALRDEPWFVWC